MIFLGKIEQSIERELVYFYKQEIRCMQLNTNYPPAIPSRFGVISKILTVSTSTSVFATEHFLQIFMVVVIMICYEISSTNLDHPRNTFMLMGDFNYRYLQWPPLLDDQCITADAVQFHNCLEDNFFTQHIEFPTRNDAILDPIITDEPDMGNDIKGLGPFPGIDRNALLWKFEIATKLEVTQKHVPDYAKANVEAIRQGLQAVDWHNLVRQFVTGEQLGSSQK